MKKKNNYKMVTIGLTMVAIFVIGVWMHLSNRTLVLYGEQHQVYLKLPIRDAEEFSVEFIHSVNKSPVIDYYQVRGKDIYVTATKYFSFGAGVQTELTGEEMLGYTKDGAMLVSGINQKMEHLRYAVAMVSDHVLIYRGQRISLKEVCGKGAIVTFSIR